MAGRYRSEIMHVDGGRPQRLPCAAKEREEADVLGAARRAESAGISGVPLYLNHGFQLARLGVVTGAHQLFEAHVAA